MRLKHALALSAALVTSGAAADTASPYLHMGIWTWIEGDKGAIDPTPEKIAEACLQASIVIVTHEDGMTIVYSRPDGAEPGQPMEVVGLARCIVRNDGMEQCIPLETDTGAVIKPPNLFLGSYEYKDPDQFEYCPRDLVTKEVSGDCNMNHRCDPALFAADPTTGRAAIDILRRPAFEQK